MARVELTGLSCKSTVLIAERYACLALLCPPYTAAALQCSQLDLEHLRRGSKSLRNLFERNPRVEEARLSLLPVKGSRCILPILQYHLLSILYNR